MMAEEIEILSLDKIRVEMRGPHLVATLDHAATKNALTDELMHELNLVLDQTRDDTAIRSLVIRGANDVFCAGADLKAALQRIDEPVDQHDPIMEMNRRVGDLYRKLHHYPKAVIAVVEGAAYGGGFGMVCCADVVLVSDQAMFALSETTLGLPPAQIAPYIVTRIGESGARRLALTGMRIDAEEALRIGLADQHCTPRELEAELLKLLNMIGKCAPQANAMGKKIIQSASPSVEVAAEAFAACLRDSEGREGVAAFGEKRAAKWVHKI